MSQNNSSINKSLHDSDQLPLVLEVVLVSPEFVNLVILFIGIYGIYQGIEIQHPLYAVLFLNISFSWFSTFINLSAFTFISTGTYVNLSNATSAIVIYFHIICWFMTTVIRYLYIVQDVWLHQSIPNVKVQSCIAIVFVFALTIALATPSFGYVIFLGEQLKPFQYFLVDISSMFTLLKF